jgi:hypothetical protein
MRRLWKPSPAIVVSVIALVFALGGSAYGLVITGRSIKNGTITGADVHNGSLSSRDMRRNSLGGRAIRESRLGPVPVAGVSVGMTHQAVVTSAGLLARGRGVASVARTGEGRYQVILDRDVRGCAYVASVGDVGAAGPPSGDATTTSLPSNVSGVVVRTTSSNGAASDKPFHLIVSC